MHNFTPHKYPSTHATKKKKLRGAMKGMGTNERKLIEVTTRHSFDQRQQIRQRFDSKFSRSLLKDLASETSGKFEKLLLSFWYAHGEYDSRQVYEAVDGMGFNTKLLNEILCTRTNAQLAAMKNAWIKSPNMVERIRSETKKRFSNNTYQTLMLNILKCNRPPNTVVNEKSAREDAELLNRMLSASKESDAKAKFVEVLSERSWVQIRAIANMFQEVSKKYTLIAAINKAFGNGSDTAKALVVIVEFCVQPYDFFAKLLFDSMEGMGTDDELLRRVVASRAEVDLNNISNIFGQRYGKGKTLNHWIKKDTSGDYEKLLLAASGF